MITDDRLDQGSAWIFSHLALKVLIYLRLLLIALTHHTPDLSIDEFPLLKYSLLSKTQSLTAFHSRRYEQCSFKHFEQTLHTHTQAAHSNNTNSNRVILRVSHAGIVAHARFNVCTINAENRTLNSK